MGHENRTIFVKHGRILISHVVSLLCVVMTFKCNAYEGINGILIDTYASKATNSQQQWLNAIKVWFALTFRQKRVMNGARRKKNTTEFVNKHTHDKNMFHIASLRRAARKMWRHNSHSEKAQIFMRRWNFSRDYDEKLKTFSNDDECGSHAMGTGDKKMGNGGQNKLMTWKNNSKLALV